MKLERRRRGDAERKVERASNVGSCARGGEVLGLEGGGRWLESGHQHLQQRTKQRHNG